MVPSYAYTTEVIVNSFKVCGISVETDGSEGSLVHCIKPASMVADATVAISAETATLLRAPIRTMWTLIPLQ